MTELTQPTHRERASTAGGLGSLFDDNHDPSGLVTVAVGPYVERLPLGNSTVAQIRARFGLRFDIDPRTQAVLDGHEVGDDTVVRTGQVLMFVHKSGEKGRRKVQGPRSKVQGSLKLQSSTWEHWESTETPYGEGVRHVAPSCTLPYRRVALGSALEALTRVARLDNSRIANPRYSRLKICATGGNHALELRAWSFPGPWTLDLGPSRHGTFHG